MEEVRNLPMLSVFLLEKCPNLNSHESTSRSVFKRIMITVCPIEHPGYTAKEMNVQTNCNVFCGDISLNQVTLSCSKEMISLENSSDDAANYEYVKNVT